jgi:hypothetical protein
MTLAFSEERKLKFSLLKQLYLIMIKKIMIVNKLNKTKKLIIINYKK